MVKPPSASKPHKAAATSSAAQSLTEGQRAYEAKRAAKAGMSLDKWLAEKARQTEAAARAQAMANQAEKKSARKPGLLSRLIDRAHKPL